MAVLYEMNINKIRQSLNNSAKNHQLILFDSSLSLLASSFSQRSQPFIPIVDFEPKSSLRFSSKGVGLSSYRTIRIDNRTDTASIFEFDDLPSYFDVFPKHGYIKGTSPYSMHFYFLDNFA